jgi:hypothetical protein
MAGVDLDAYHAALFHCCATNVPRLGPMCGTHFYDHDVPASKVPLLACRNPAEVVDVHLAFSSPLPNPTVVSVQRGDQVTCTTAPAGAVRVDMDLHDFCLGQEDEAPVAIALDPRPANVRARLKSRFVSAPVRVQRKKEKQVIVEGLRKWYLAHGRTLPRGVVLDVSQMEQALAVYAALPAITHLTVNRDSWGFAVLSSPSELLAALDAGPWAPAPDQQAALLCTVRGGGAAGAAFSKKCADARGDDCVCVSARDGDLWCGFRLDPPVDTDDLSLVVGWDRVPLKVRNGAVRFSYPLILTGLTFTELCVQMPGLSNFEMTLELVYLRDELRDFTYSVADDHCTVRMPRENFILQYHGGRGIVRRPAPNQAP